MRDSFTNLKNTLVNAETIKKLKWLLKILLKGYDTSRYLSNPLNWVLDNVADSLNEVDHTVQEWMRRNKTHPAAEEYCKEQNGDVQPFCVTKEHEKIVELFEKYMDKRNTFLGNFPIWKKYRLENIKSLKGIAEECQKADTYKNNMSLLASFFGLVSGAINIARSFEDCVPESVRTVASVFSAANGAIRAWTSTEEQLLLESLFRKANEKMDLDKRQFETMMIWFKYNDELRQSIKSAIGDDLYKFIFVSLKACYDNVRVSDQSEICKARFDAMVNFLIKSQVFGTSLVVPIAAISLKLFTILSSAFLSLSWPDAAKNVKRLTTGVVALANVAHAGTAVNDIFNPNENSSNGLGSGRLGIIMDIGPSLLDISQMGKPSEHAIKIREVVQILRQNLNHIEKVYNSFKTTNQ